MGSGWGGMGMGKPLSGQKSYVTEKVVNLAKQMIESGLGGLGRYCASHLGHHSTMG